MAFLAFDIQKDLTSLPKLLLRLRLIGYSGLGGRELLALAKENQVGWQVEFGDWQGFLSGTNRLIQRFEQQPKKLATQLQGLSNEVRKSYSFQAMIQSVAKALPRWESQLPN